MKIFLVFLIWSSGQVLLAQHEMFTSINSLRSNVLNTEINRPDSSKSKENSKNIKILNKDRLYTVFGLTGVFAAGTYAFQIQPWWTGKKTGFHLRYDWYDNYWKDMDKLGHFVANIHLTRLSAESFEWAGIERRKALWLGFTNSTFLYTAFELTDAGFEDWGFSVPDFVANLLGAGYPILQEHFPVLSHFNFKWSYWPSIYFQNDEPKNKPGFKNYETYEYLLHDYDGMTFWLSADIDWLLPYRYKSFWPDWLNIAIGYTAKNLPQDNHALKYREYILAFDYNFLKLPGNNSVLKTLKFILNVVHFPAPAIKFGSKGITYYLFY